jgi:hypothetical protein
MTKVEESKMTKVKESKIEWTDELRAMYPKTCISDMCDASDPTMWRRGLCGMCYTRERTRVESGLITWRELEENGQAAPLLPEHKDEVKTVDLSVTTNGVSAGMSVEELASETGLE